MIPYHIRSFLGGIANWDDKGLAGSFKFGQALDIRKKRDTLTCQQAFKDYIATGTLTNLAMFTVIGDDGNVYFFCRDGKIFRVNGAGNVLLVYQDTNESGNIIGAAQWYDNTGNTYLLYATATRLNIKRIIGPSYTNSEPWTDLNTVPTGTWPKTNLTSSSWHTMKVANGDLFIANSQYVAMVGYDMSYTNNALQMIPGNIAKALEERGTFLLSGANKVSLIEQCGLYEWDGVSLSYNDKKLPKVSGLNSLIDTEIGVMQVGSNGQLYSSDLKNPMPFFAYPGGGQTYPDAVCSDRGMAMFGIYGNTNANGIYSYGRLDKNAKIVPNCDYPLVCDEIGSISKIGQTLLVTYRLGTNYGVKIVDINNKAPAIYQALDLITPLGTRRYPIPMGRQLNWAYVELFFDKLPTGCGIEVWYRFDKLTSQWTLPNGAQTDANGWIQANLVDQPSTYRLSSANTQHAQWAINEHGRVFEFMIKLFPNGNATPEIYEANVYFNAGM